VSIVPVDMMSPCLSGEELDVDIHDGVIAEMNFDIIDFFGAGFGICSRVSKIASSWNFLNSS